MNLKLRPSQMGKELKKMSFRPTLQKGAELERMLLLALSLVMGC